jgi:plasmid stabilization system protein ParE
MTFRLHPAARLEVADAIKHYEAEKRGLGRKFAGQVREAIRQVLRFPNAWQRVEVGCRRYRLRKFPYGLVYRVLGEDVLFVAVMHLSRDPGYWVSRL